MSNAMFIFSGRVAKVLAKDVSDRGYFNIDLAVDKSYPDPEKEGEFKDRTEFYFMKVLGKKVPKTFTVGNIVTVSGETWQQKKPLADPETGEVQDHVFTGFTVRDYKFLAAPKNRTQGNEEG